MIKLKNERGSVTLFVLASCMFFIASVVCVNMYIQSKQISVDREYKQIKSNYEKDLNMIDTIYDDLANIENAKTSVTFSNPLLNKTLKQISLDITLDTSDIKDNKKAVLKTLKYGWIYSASAISDFSDKSETITDWTFVQNNFKTNLVKASTSYTQNSGYYYLCFMIDNKEKWYTTGIEIN